MTIDQKRIELSKYRTEKAYERLEAARILLRSSLWNDADNRSCYAVFTAARSLLALFDLDSKKHSGVISLFNRHFIKTGYLPKHLSRIMARAKQGRESSDYADFIECTGEEAENQIDEAKEFLQAVQTLIEKILKNEIVISSNDFDVSTER